ncbi:hypothetical protein TA3x_000230 [Tundrisphaera sp. TA3]|uniref:hypothetical protein n=1 Tax=Tundrisphaera sp. TA3 TaxID=3435775 RepID=UPI003EBD585C
MAKTRRTFTPESMAQAAWFINEGGKGLAEVARDHGRGESRSRGASADPGQVRRATQRADEMSLAGVEVHES